VVIAPLLAAVATGAPDTLGAIDPVATAPAVIFLVSMLARALAASADRRSARHLAQPRKAVERAANYQSVVAWATAWFAARGAAGTDRPAAEAAIGDLYRLAGHPAPILVWVRSMREMAIVRPIMEGFLDGLGSGQSPADAWLDAVCRGHPIDQDTVWKAAVARTRAQVAQQIGAAERRACSSVHADLIAPVDRDNDVTRVRAHLMSAWQTSRPVRTARVVAYQLTREGWETAARRGLPIGDGLETAHLASLNYLRVTTGRRLPADWEAGGRLLRACAGAAALDGAALLLEHPATVREDDRGLIHATDGPAIRWSDGFTAWALDGHGVPREVVEDPDEMTVALIRSEARGNIERHRLLVRTLGTERYLAAAGATPDLIAAELDPVLQRGLIARFGEGPYAAAAGRLIHHDIDGLGQVRRLWGVARRDDAPLVVVEVANSTPEPDGTRTRHWLRVPPGTATCQEAVAWTFGVRDAEYHPLVET
jgi:hypothetical protein